MDAPPVKDESVEKLSVEKLEEQRLQADSDAVGTTSTEIFSDYRPSHPNGGPAQPGDVAEAASLAATSAPKVDYPLCRALVEGTLSDLQLETIALACHRHLSVIPATGSTPATRCGFFLGDGAGVGKGRQLAGIILDNLSRGRTRHVWFSSSADLRHDAERDLKDLGVHVARDRGSGVAHRGHRDARTEVDQRVAVDVDDHPAARSGDEHRQRGADPG